MTVVTVVVVVVVGVIDGVDSVKAEIEVKKKQRVPHNNINDASRAWIIVLELILLLIL